MASLRNPLSLLAWSLALLWAGFWIWFGAGSGIVERLAWQDVVLHALRPGGMFLGVVLVAWLVRRAGPPLLFFAGVAAGALYLYCFAHMPFVTKLFVLATMAVPPIVSGVLLHWQMHRQASQTT